MIKVDLRDLCTITQGIAHQHMPEWANLNTSIVKGIRKSVGDLAGPGVYACFWNDTLIYIGSYSGTKNDPFGGHVIERAFKHIIGFTLRADQLFFNDRPLQSIINHVDHEIARDLAAALQRGDRARSEGGIKTTLGANGAICATKNKVIFASRHWDILRHATPDELFNRLGFAYRRIEPPAGMTSKKTIKGEWIKTIEDKLILAFEPTCNTKGRLGPDGPPAQLHQVSEALDKVMTLG